MGFVIPKMMSWRLEGKKNKINVCFDIIWANGEDLLLG